MIIWSLTSWKQRIGSCLPTIKTMLDQTMKVPVELNLDHENFPNERADLPQELVELEKSNPLFTIYFDRERDAHCWQKMQPTWKRHDDQPLVLFTADDDIQYPQNYVEKSLECLNGNDWLCTSHETLTQGQTCVYGWRAVEALRRHVTEELMFECPLDDFPVYHIMQKYGLRRGKPSFPGSWDTWDRNIPYSFRREFYKDQNPEEIFKGYYPQEEFNKELEYMRKVGIL